MIPWFSKKLREILTPLCCIIPSSSGKTNAVLKEVAATEDVIPTEEYAEEVIPEHEERHAGAPEENGAEENADQIPQREPAHPRVTNLVQIEKIISDINIPGPLTRSRASHLSNFCGHFAFVSIIEPTKVDEAFLEPEWIQAMQEELHQFEPIIL